MAIVLGVDTGGTYTDAVLLQDEKTVLSSAKSLTTRHDLAQGVGAAIDAVLGDSRVAPGDIAMASLSTTLATNALVEEQGGRVALVFIGFQAADLRRQGLEDSLKGDPVILLSGGHSHAGSELSPLDVAGLRAALGEWGDKVSAFAVASQFATRNPAHEIAATKVIRQMCAKPVSCSHELSSRLNGPKRAMTAILNARLIGMIDHLISSSEALMRDRGIRAPLMVVRGDGALISASMARARPIETILSGPAASLVGARWLTGARDALVSDIGGTTTDVALLVDGRPVIDPDGAQVGPYRTMVQAVAMRTSGLGGDSQLHMVQDGLSRALSLGPRRVLPVSLCAMDWPERVHQVLDRQLASEQGGEFDARFVVPIQREGQALAGLSSRELVLLERIGDQAREFGQVIANRMEIAALERLVSLGLVMISAPTPSDASHVLGRLDVWDKSAAQKALTLFGRQRTGAGRRLCDDPLLMAQMVVDQLTEQTAEALLITAFAKDSFDFGQPPEVLARHVLARKGLDHHRGILALDLGLNLPVVGLGASASSYYGAVGKRLSCEMILPRHADVANALGAVVGQILMRKSGTVTARGEGRYRVHFQTGPQDFIDCEAALAALEDDLRDAALTQALAAGAEEVQITATRQVQMSRVEGREVFVEAEITAQANGRPRIASREDQGPECPGR